MDRRAVYAELTALCREHDALEYQIMRRLRQFSDAELDVILDPEPDPVALEAVLNREAGGPTPER